MNHKLKNGESLFKETKGKGDVGGIFARSYVGESGYTFTSAGDDVEGRGVHVFLSEDQGGNEETVYADAARK